MASIARRTSAARRRINAAGAACSPRSDTRAARPTSTLRRHQPMPPVGRPVSCRRRLRSTRTVVSSLPARQQHTTSACSCSEPPIRGPPCACGGSSLGVGVAPAATERKKGSRRTLEKEEHRVPPSACASRRVCSSLGHRVGMESRLPPPKGRKKGSRRTLGKEAHHVHRSLRRVFAAHT